MIFARIKVHVVRCISSMLIKKKDMNLNKIKNIKYMLPVLLLSLVSFVSPPPDFLKSLQINLETWRSQYAPEKVYLQLDKPYYAPGQIIWLKGYVLEAASLRPSAKSGVLYVDLLNQQNQPVERLTLKAEKGKTTGDISLPTDLPPGNYRLVAYTQWMRNFGENTFFNLAFPVLGVSDTSAETSVVNANPDVQFFPEGGDLIAGISNRVAFKATSPTGTGIAVNGSVYDDQGRKITDFADTHLGMGAFVLEPQPGRQYIARVKTTAGKTAEYTLPAVKQAGYVLYIDEITDANNLLVTVTGKTTKAESLILTGISRDALQFSRQFSLQSGQTNRLSISKKDFPTGIVRFNLARANGEPLAERLAFVDHQDDLQLSIISDKKSYAGRDQVTLQLEARDHQGKPVATDFGLAVTDNELVKTAENGLNLKSHLLLASDLKGQVEEPGYYFVDNAVNRKEALSYLLMTQGWRRFSWQETTAGSFPAIKYAPETDLTVRGRLVTNKGKAIAGGEALLYLQGQHLTFITTETNKEGEFAFGGFDFTGNIEVVVQGTDARGRRHNLQVKMTENNFAPTAPAVFGTWTVGLVASTRQEFIKANYRQMTLTAEEKNAYTLRGILLSTVEVKGEQDMVVPFSLHQQADVVISGNALPVAPSGNIIQSLQGRVAGLQVYQTGPNQFRASIRGQMNPPLYLLDGMPVSESTVASLNQFDLNRIEILKNGASASIYGGQASGGVIAFFTNRGGEEPVEVQPGRYIITHQLKGYSKVREFYSPRYDNQNTINNEPDLRTTLYWNPNVKTNADGKAAITFYTADRSTTYRAFADGISEEGKAGSATLTFGVTNKKRNL